MTGVQTCALPILRAAGKLETAADAAAKRKADLEASMPALESQAKALQNTVNSLKAEISSKRAQFNKELEDIGKAAEKALADKHAKAEADHQLKVDILKADISTLGGTISHLEKQKADIESQIGALRKSIEGARAAFHV